MYLLPGNIVDKRIFIYGAGVVGGVYKRRLKELGKEYLLEAFVETKPKNNSYLNYPIISLEDLRKKECDYQILIASIDQQDKIKSLLNAVGVSPNRIKSPIVPKYTESKRILFRKLSKSREVLVLPEIKSRSTFDKIMNVINGYLKRSDQDVKFHIDLEEDSSIISLHEMHIDPRVLIHKKNDGFENMNLKNQLAEKCDLVVIYEAQEFISIDERILDKCFFFKASNRAIQKFNNLRISQIPYMDVQGLKLYESILRESKCYLEYGAGSSTIYAVKAGVNKIISIDTSKIWIDKVKSDLDKISCFSSDDIDLIYCNIGPVGDWGRPVDESGLDSYHLYSKLPWEIVKKKGLRPDLILIDGRFRVASFLYTLMHADSGAIILFDDYVNRDCYHVVEDFCKPLKVCGRMAVFEVKNNYNSHDLVSMFSKYSIIPD